MKNIRNFCIIAHIDHGKSTLADRLLERTQTIKVTEGQMLDDMDLERERGITIKSHAIQMDYTQDGQHYTLNLIDTPGHVDFSYEVSRSIAACEGCLLLVDSTQGVQAQTISNLYMAIEHDLEIIPVLSKCDMVNSMPEEVEDEIIELLGCKREEIIRASGKTGEGVDNILRAIIEKVQAPVGEANAPLQAMIFDSVFNPFRGIIAYYKIINGSLHSGEEVVFVNTGQRYIADEIGVLKMELSARKELHCGDVGYIVSGIKTATEVKVGDTITSVAKPCEKAIAGFEEVKPMVFAGLYPVETEDFENLRTSLEKLQLNDASLTFSPESSVALGFGFRCGFLGLLHLEIVRERLEREFKLDLIATAPNVVYKVVAEDGTEIQVDNPSEFPEGKISEVREPVVNATILTPTEFTGTIMELCQDRRGTMRGMDYLSEDRVELHYQLPLAEIVFDFFDHLKSRTRGYASLDYHESGEQVADLVKVDILLNGDRVDAFSAIVHKDQAYAYGLRMTKRLKELIPRQQFEIPVQAAVGARVIARENIKALRKDMLAKCYGGDITRKRKLLEKQKEGKKRMKSIGRVDVPQEAFIAALTSDVPTGKK